jgi:hypothetical protein
MIRASTPGINGKDKIFPSPDPPARREPIPATSIPIPNPMTRYYIPFRLQPTLAVVFLILCTFSVLGRDETRLDRSCTSYASAAACRRF